MPFFTFNFEDHSKSRFIFIFSAVTSSFLALIALFNLWMDPAELFSSTNGLESRLAKKLAQSENLIISQNYDERKFQIFRLKYENYLGDTLVLGSSRVMQIGNKTIGRKVFNLGVSGATIQDVIALLSQAIKRYQYKTIIIGLDPWILNEKPNQERWRSIQELFNSGVLEIDPTFPVQHSKPFNFDTVPQLLNLAYTKESVRKLKKNLEEQDVDDTDLNDTPKEKLQIIRKDGSRVYDLEFQKYSPQKIEQDKKVFAEYAIANFVESPNNERLLRLLVEKFSLKSELIFFLPPYHPSTFEIIRRETPNVLKVELILNSLAAENNIKVIGSYDPAKTPCSRELFFDGAHPRPECICSLFEACEKILE